jgi:DNA-binding NarL/FixJ family response regulator
MPGTRLLKEVKERYPGITVLLMSSKEHEAVISKFKAMGADGFIGKPFHNNEILSSVEPFVD